MIERLDRSRREALAGIGLLAMAPAALDSAVPAAALGFDRNARPARGDGDALLRDFIRMRTSPDGAPVLWPYAGVLVVKPEGEVARPVARIEGLSRSKATARPDGTWLWELDEAGYYCDLATGEALERMTNPFTGAEIRPRHYRSKQALVFTDQGVLPGQQLPPGVEFRGEITRLAAVAGTVALTEDLYVRVPAAAATTTTPQRPARLAASLATFTTLARNLSRAPREWVACQFNYTTLNSFVDWLAMNGRAGVQDMRLVGVKCRIDDRGAVSEWLRTRVRADHPGLI